MDSPSPKLIFEDPNSTAERRLYVATLGLAGNIVGAAPAARHHQARAQAPDD
jgi:hypothetical protein